MTITGSTVSRVLVAVLCGLILARSGGHPFAQDAATANVRAIYAAGLAAYEKKDYPEYLHRLEEASTLRPTHPIIAWRLAGACALNARPDAAAGVLRKLAALTLYYDVLNDKDFADVRAHPAIQDAARLLEPIRHRRIGESDTAWTIDDKTFIPEGITFDPATTAFFVSSQYKRKIVRIDSSGAVRDFATRADGLWMVFGIAVDPARRLLWAVSTAERQMEDFTPADENRTAVFAFNLDTARLVHRYDLGPHTPAHRFDDLAVLNDGRVFISDGGSGAIYTVAPGAHSLRLFVAPGTIQGPNGIAPSPDGRSIYVADYAGFIFRVDTTTAATTRLGAPSDVALYGIDGLAWDHGSLVAVQNGVNPERVLRLALTDDGTRITNATILDMGNARVAEPTLGVVVGGAFYYVANSHGGLLRKPNSVLATQPLTAPVILKLRLR